jgi:uncharacterized membrane protein
MTSYAYIHRANERFMLGVMVFLVIAFIAAMLLMFLHPSGALFMFALGLVVAMVSAVVVKVAKRSERAAVRAAIDAHECPECGGPIRDEAGAWRCDECDHSFLASGVVRA